MEYRVQLVVGCAGGRLVDGRINGAIRGAGCAVEGRVRLRAAPGDVQQLLTVRLPTMEHLHRVVRAVESVQGAAVMEVRASDPLEAATLE
jgi:hypothetical protein